MTLTDVELKKMIEDGSKAAVDAALAEKAAADKAHEEEHKTALRAQFQEVYEANRMREDSSGVKAMTPMQKLGRIIIAAAAGQCDPEKMLAFSKKNYDGDKELDGYIKKTMEAGVPSTGGFTIPHPVMGQLIEPLYQETFLDKIGMSKLPMPNGNLTLPRVNTSSTVGWVGEIPATTPTGIVLGDVKLSAKKLYAKLPISNSLLRYSAVGLESFCARDLQRKLTLAVNDAALYGTGGSYQPLGLSGITGIQSSGSASTALTAAATVDMISLLRQANVAMSRPYWVMSPAMEGWLKNLKTTVGAFIYRDEMNNSKTVEGIPFVVTTGSSYTDTTTDYADLWLGDWDYFLWGASRDMELTMSKEATYMSGATAYSAFDRDETVIKVVAEHDFNVSQPLAFVHGIYSVA